MQPINRISTSTNWFNTLKKYVWLHLIHVLQFVADHLKYWLTCGFTRFWGENEELGPWEGTKSNAEFKP